MQFLVGICFVVVAVAHGAHVELGESATMEQRLGIMEKNFQGMQERTDVFLRAYAEKMEENAIAQGKENSKEHHHAQRLVNEQRAMFAHEFDYEQHKEAVLLEMSQKGHRYHTSEKVQEKALYDVMESYEHYQLAKHQIAGVELPNDHAVLMETRAQGSLRAGNFTRIKKIAAFFKKGAKVVGGGFIWFVTKAMQKLKQAVIMVGKFIRALLKSIYVGIGGKFDVLTGPATTLEFCFGVHNFLGDAAWSNKGDSFGDDMTTKKEGARQAQALDATNEAEEETKQATVEVNKELGEMESLKTPADVGSPDPPLLDDGSPDLGRMGDAIGTLTTNENATSQNEATSARHEKTHVAKGFFSTVKMMIKKGMAAGSGKLDATTCQAVAEGHKAFELKFCFAFHWGALQFAGAPHMLIVPPASLAMPETAASFIANSVLLKCIQETVTGFVLSPVKLIGSAALNTKAGNATMKKIKFVQKSVLRFMGVKDSLAGSDVDTEQHATKHEDHGSHGGHALSCDHDPNIDSDVDRLKCKNKEAEGTCKGSAHLHSCADTMSVVVGIFHAAVLTLPGAHTPHVTGFGVPIGIDYSMKSCGNAFVKGIQAGLRKLIGTKTDPSSAESISAQHNGQENTDARDQLEIERLNNEQDRQTEMMANGLCNPSCDKVDTFHAIAVAIPGMMSGPALAQLVMGTTAAVGSIGGKEHRRRRLLSKHNRQLSNPGLDAFGSGHAEEGVVHAAKDGVAHVGKDGVAHVGKDGVAHAKGGAHDDHHEAPEGFMIETVFTVGPVWDAAMCFAKAIRNIFWGIKNRNKMAICKEPCSLKKNAWPLNTCKTFGEPKFDSAESGISDRTESRGICVPLGGKEFPDAGTCQRCMAADNVCRFDTDCASGYCSGNRMGMRDGKCLKRDLPGGSPCSRHAECHSAPGLSAQCDGWYRGGGYKGACRTDKTFAREDYSKLKCGETVVDLSSKDQQAQLMNAGCNCARNSQCLSRACAGASAIGGGAEHGTCSQVGPTRLKAIDDMNTQLSSIDEEKQKNTKHGMGCQPSNICCVSKTENKCVNQKNDNFGAGFAFQSQIPASFDCTGAESTGEKKSSFFGSKADHYRPRDWKPNHKINGKPHEGFKKKKANNLRDGIYEQASCSHDQFYAGHCLCYQCPDGFEAVAFTETEKQAGCCDASKPSGLENAYECLGNKDQCLKATSTYDGLVLAPSEFTAFQGKVTKHYSETFAGMRLGSKHKDIFMQIKVHEINGIRTPSRLIWGKHANIVGVKLADLRHQDLYDYGCNHNYDGKLQKNITGIESFELTEVKIYIDPADPKTNRVKITSWCSTGPAASENVAVQQQHEAWKQSKGRKPIIQIVSTLKGENPKNGAGLICPYIGSGDKAPKNAKGQKQFCLVLENFSEERLVQFIYAINGLTEKQSTCSSRSAADELASQLQTGPPQVVEAYAVGNKGL